MIITISGLPGSGKSTVAGILKKKLGWDYVYTGALFRKMAQEHGMTLEQFGSFCESHPEVDKELDARQLEIAKASKNMILEGRMAGNLVFAERKRQGFNKNNTGEAKHLVFAERKNNKLDALTVWLDAPIETRVKRIMKRESGSFEQRLAEAKKRETSEAARYKKYYGVDLYDKKAYDLVIDVSKISAEQAAEIILKKASMVKNIKAGKHT